MTHPKPPFDKEETQGLRTLEDLLFPVTEADFMRDYDGRQPLHIPAGDHPDKAGILTWQAFNGLLQQTHIWTTETLRLMLDGEGVRPEQYCKPIATLSGPIMRPSPSMVDVFLSGGASLVANDMLHAHPPLTQVGHVLGRTFAATVGANVYCSFQGVRAFGSHYDNHDVFVVQTEGEKVWTLYENRADNPVELLPGNDDTQRFFERSRGAVMSQVRLRRGDVLYLPRGWYHDALATDGASLHVTFSVTPATGLDLMKRMEAIVRDDPVFRHFLRPAAMAQPSACPSSTTSAMMSQLSACATTTRLPVMVQFSARCRLTSPLALWMVALDAMPVTMTGPSALRALPPIRFRFRRTTPPRETTLPNTSACTVMLSPSTTRFSWTSPNSS